MSRLIATFALLFGLTSSVRAESKTFSDVEKVFAKASSEYPVWALKEGTDFLAPAGTVIFMSREEGVRWLVAYARSGRPEIAMLYAPTLGAWITVTIESYPRRVMYQGNYVLAVLLVEGVAEWWHVHNKMKENPTEWHRFEKGTKWVMPSSIDLRQAYSYAHEMPKARATGHIAHPLGTTDFWSTKSRRKLIQVLNSVDTEGMRLREGVNEVPEQEIPAFANRHKGRFRIRYEPVP